MFRGKNCLTNFHGKFEWENSWIYIVKVVVLEKLLGMRQVLKLNRLMDMSHQSKDLFKIQAFNGDR